MQSTLTPHANWLTQLEPSDSTCLVKVRASSLTPGTIEQLYSAGESQSEDDVLRTWLRTRIGNESARRAGGRTEELEPETWLLPWHQWTDRQLQAALITSFTWTLGDVLNPQVRDILSEVHKSVVMICACRLGELATAIELARRNSAE